MYGSLVARVLYVGVVAYLLFFTISDRAVHIAVSIVLAGSAANVLVMAANAGRMPVRGNFKPDDNHCAVCPDTNFRYLCDRHRIQVGQWGTTTSIGDIFICMGMLLFYARILTL
jgi:hypothetical protein